MRVLYSALLAIILIFIFIYSYKKTRDLFSPLCIFSLFTFIRYIPSMLSKDYEYFTYLNDANTGKVFLAELIAIASVIAGYNFYQKHTRSKYYYFEISYSKNEWSVSLLQILFIYIIGITARVSIIVKSGGIQYVIAHMASAYANLSSGSGYANILSYLSIVALLLLLSKISLAEKNGYKRIGLIVLFVLMSVIYAGTYLAFSSRSPAIELLMILAFGYNYIYRKIKARDIFKPRVVALIVVIMMIVVVMPSLRVTSVSSNISDRTSIFESFQDNVNNIFDEFSYVGRDAFVYDYFNLNNFWMGKSYLLLLSAPIPNSMLQDKPPVDDGIYLCNLMYGYDVSPPTGRNKLTIKYSIPFSTPGAIYANFGIIGIIIAEFVLGILYAYVYKRLLDTNSTYTVFVYQLIIYQLELGVLSIVQTLMPMVLLFVISKLITGFVIYKVPKNNSGLNYRVKRRVHIHF